MALIIRRNGTRHGVFLPDCNYASVSPIEPAPLPPKVVIPLHQGNGRLCNALVNKGDRVLSGQKIGDSDDFNATPVHATLSGEVSAIVKLIQPTSGRPQDALIITSDGRDECIDYKAPENPESLSVKDILDRVRQAGITGGGGDNLPAHIKLSPPEDKKIDTVILNGCHCEPCLTSNHGLMLDNGAEVLSGLSIIRKVLSPSTTYIAIENNRYTIIDKMEEMIKASGVKDFKIVLLKSKYPAAAEKSLVQSILSKEVPIGGTAADIGVVVFEASMVKAIHDAVVCGKPFIEKVITIAGSVNKPRNLLARFGTPLRYLIEYCGGIKGDADKLITSGLMTGATLYDLDFPFTKEMNCILVDRSTPTIELDCIRCGKCLEVCPARLSPTLLASYARAGRYNECREAYIDSCFECGACAYICPASIPLLQYIKIAKAEIDKRTATE